jgi:hypothetical protein
VYVGSLPNHCTGCCTLITIRHSGAGKAGHPVTDVLSLVTAKAYTKRTQPSVERLLPHTGLMHRREPCQVQASGGAYCRLDTCSPCVWRQTALATRHDAAVFRCYGQRGCFVLLQGININLRTGSLSATGQYCQIDFRTDAGCTRRHRICSFTTQH